MRTKHLLTAMVLPALFAACTSEELDVVNNVESLNSRAEVENVTLTVGETVDSRLVYDGGYSFEAGDQLGAALMDDITANYGDPTKTWGEWFTLLDYIHTNYKFTRDAEGNWETEAKLCEGNYFFAYPYNMNQGLREAYAFSCEDQVLEGTDAASLKKAYVENNSFVGYGKVVRSNEEGESVAVPMVPVFGATGIILTNRGTEERTIEKIVLRGDKITTLAVVQPATAKFNVDTYAANLKDGSAAALKANDEALAGIIKYSTPVNDNNESNDFIEVYVKSGNTIANGESMNLIVMTGAAEVAEEGDIVMDIYSTRGVIRDIELTTKYTAQGKDDIVTDKALTALGAGQKIEVEFSHSTFEVEDCLEVYSSDDLAQLIKWNAEAKTERAISAKLMDNVVLTKAMYEKLVSTKMITKATIDLADHKLTIAADADAKAFDAFNFINGGEVEVLGTQDIKNTKSTKPGFILVAKDATLNVSTNLNMVKNLGVVNMAAKDITINFINNFKTVNVNANSSFGILKNHSELTNNAVLAVTGEAYNYGTINNNGTISATAKFINEVAMSTECGEDNIKHGKGVIKNAGKILTLTNNGLIEMMLAEARAEVTGNGEIDNTIQSAYVKGGANTIFVKVADKKASELAAIVVNAGATKIKVSGTITVDPAKNETGVNVDAKEIEAIANLTIAGKGGLNAGSAKLIVNKNVEVLVKNGAALNVASYEGSANGGSLLTIETGAGLSGTEGANIKVEDYRK